jgi:hypothetical protein
LGSPSVIVVNVSGLATSGRVVALGYHLVLATIFLRVDALRTQPLLFF